jgi:hypothetical protein
MCGRFTKFALGVGLVLSALTLSAIPTSGMPVIDRGVAIAARPESSLETIEQARWVCGSYRGTGGGRRPYWRRYWGPRYYYYGYGWPWYRWARL